MMMINSWSLSEHICNEQHEAFLRIDLQSHGLPIQVDLLKRRGANQPAQTPSQHQEEALKSNGELYHDSLRCKFVNNLRKFKFGINSTRLLTLLNSSN